MSTTDHHRPSSPEGRTRAVCASGFSIIELVVVLAIISIASAFAIGRYSSSMSRYRADLAARRLQQDLLLAQSRARSTADTRMVTVDQPDGSYRLVGEKPLRPSDIDYRVSLRIEPFLTLIRRIDTPNGSPQIVFDGYGTPNQAMQIVLASGPDKRTVTVSASGVVSVSNP